MSSSKLLLIILDGWGIGKKNEHNPIYLAHLPFYNKCWRGSDAHPYIATSSLKASGESVGVMPGQIGSSEVGHMHIGAGRIVKQELVRINQTLKDSSFYQNEQFIKACKYAKQNNSKLHFLGLVSDGGVHSHQKHLYGLLNIAREQKVSKVYVHAFLDGRDTPPASGFEYLKKLMRVIRSQSKAGTEISLATISGRFYPMDRDSNWDRTEKALAMLVNGDGVLTNDYCHAIELSYQKEIFDEFIEPIIIDQSGTITENDSLIFFNFRSDRMRQLVESLYKIVSNVKITTMIPYGVENVKAVSAFERDIPEENLASVLSNNKIPFLKITETQKYAHLTYFFNGTREKPYMREDRIMIPSKPVEPYDKLPEMSAREITDEIINKHEKYQIIIVNYPNGDLVGHTGNIKAGIKAAECLDKQLEILTNKLLPRGFEIIITSDHGNLEKMYDVKNDTRHTAHTTHLVPFILMSQKKYQLKAQGGLINIAPTVLELLRISKPKEMGESLIL